MVNVKGRLNLRVAHEGLDGLGVGSCVDQERGERMAALVQRDRGEQLGIVAIGLLLLRSRLKALHAALARLSTVEETNASCGLSAVSIPLEQAKSALPCSPHRFSPPCSNPKTRLGSPPGRFLFVGL